MLPFFHFNNLVELSLFAAKRWWLDSIFDAKDGYSLECTHMQAGAHRARMKFSKLMHHYLDFIFMNIIQSLLSTADV